MCLAYRVGVWISLARARDALPGIPLAGELGVRRDGSGLHGLEGDAGCSALNHMAHFRVMRAASFARIAIAELILISEV